MTTRAETSNLYRALARRGSLCAVAAPDADDPSVVPLRRENLPRTTYRPIRPGPQIMDSDNAPAPVRDSNPI
jgi:hypothetical protein